MFFEVEHSTEFQKALIKFFELRDYFVKFIIVADKLRKMNI